MWYCTNCNESHKAGIRLADGVHCAKCDKVMEWRGEIPPKHDNEPPESISRKQDRKYWWDRD